MAQTFDEICKEAGILERNPAFAEDYAEQLRKAQKADALTFDDCRNLGLDWQDARKAFSWFFKSENIPTATADHETRFRFALNKDAACNVVVAADKAYRDACDKYFGVKP